jgi:hypothetical protein
LEKRFFFEKKKQKTFIYKGFAALTLLVSLCVLGLLDTQLTDPPMPPKKSAKPVVEPPVDVPVKEVLPPAAVHHDAHAVVPPVVENLLAPEFFATEAQSISLVQGMISIAFSSARYDYSEHPSVLKKVVVSRVVMSPIGAQSLAVRLFAFLDQKGLGPAPKDPKQRQ